VCKRDRKKRVREKGRKGGRKRKIEEVGERERERERVFVCILFYTVSGKQDKKE
jgi:hypothetical protein